MVRVSWEQNTGDLVSVRSGEGPGSYSSDVDLGEVKDVLESTNTISEPRIAAAVAGVHEGNEPIQTIVTTETYEEPDNPGTKTTLAFIEIASLTEKLTRIICNSCGFHPDNSTCWDSQEREGTQLQYKDWKCPDCSSIVHTEGYRI